MDTTTSRVPNMLSPQHPRGHVWDYGQLHLAQLQEAWTPSLCVRPEWGDPIQQDREGRNEGEVPMVRLPSLLFGDPQSRAGRPPWTSPPGSGLCTEQGL